MREDELIHMTEEEFEQKQQWTHLGGTVATAQEVYQLLLDKAGYYFTNGRDETAEAFRSFARSYEEKVVKPQSAELQKFINGRTG